MRGEEEAVFGAKSGKLAGRPEESRLFACIYEAGAQAKRGPAVTRRSTNRSLQRFRKMLQPTKFVSQKGVRKNTFVSIAGRV
jgi:hypothetical protein